MSARVLAAMSGGVDSGVAAALLVEQGCDVTGVTLKLWCYGSAGGARNGAPPARACCTLEAIEEARAVARRFGFPHFVVDAEETFRARVVRSFADEYAAGRTPYPCALCNRHLKFGDLVSRMEPIGAEHLATGHYARIGAGPDGAPALLRAADAAKDQSYALALVPRAVLGRVRFPLGALTKDEVRAHGKRLGLALWDRPESQDLCFADGDRARFVMDTLGDDRGGSPGPLLDEAGRRLGTHRGIARYTVGQRRGLGLAAPEPLYVLAIDAEANAVVVGPRSSLDVPRLLAGPMNWFVASPPAAGTRARVKIRSTHAGADATLHPREDGACEARFDRPLAAVAPGQLAVFYDGERVLGGAPIASTPRAAVVSCRADATAGR